MTDGQAYECLMQLLDQSLGLGLFKSVDQVILAKSALEHVRQRLATMPAAGPAGKVPATGKSGAAKKK